MAHPIPKELKEESRLFTIPYLNIHYTGKGTIYAAVATAISGVIFKITNFPVFIVSFIILNAIAYPLGHAKTDRSKLDGGNLAYDKFLIRKYLYKKNRHKQIYVRRRKE